MTYELKWLLYTLLMTGLLWFPYIIDRINVRGLVPALRNPTPNDKPQSPWAQRAMKAHANAVENLVLFAPAVLAVHALGISTSTTRNAVVVYFFARLAHYFIYTVGLPFLRTIVFAISLVSVFALVLSALGMI